MTPKDIMSLFNGLLIWWVIFPTLIEQQIFWKLINPFILICYSIHKYWTVIVYPYYVGFVWCNNVRSGKWNDYHFSVFLLALCLDSILKIGKL